MTQPTPTIERLETLLFDRISKAQRNGLSPSMAISVGVRPYLEQLINLDKPTAREIHLEASAVVRPLSSHEFDLIEEAVVYRLANTPSLSHRNDLHEMVEKLREGRLMYRQIDSEAIDNKR